MHNGDTWEKKNSSSFDVGQGAYDGAEIAELCDLFIMYKIVEDDGNNEIFRFRIIFRIKINR